MSKKARRSWVYEISHSTVIMKHRRDSHVLIENVITHPRVQRPLLSVPGGYRIWNKLLIMIDNADDVVLELPITKEQRDALGGSEWWGDDE